MEKLGLAAYALFSQKCIDATDVDPAELAMLEHSETYDELGLVPVWVHDVERRWQEEEERVRVRVGPDEMILHATADTKVPAQAAWEFLTQPGQRMSWQPWVTLVEVKGAEGGRRGVGSSNHCMHGADAVVEEILDWRPFDYVTDRTILETPDGPVSVLHTIDFEETDSGTTIQYRFGPAGTPREQAAMEVIAPGYGEALRSAFPELVSQLESEFDARNAERNLEPG